MNRTTTSAHTDRGCRSISLAAALCAAALLSVPGCSGPGTPTGDSPALTAVDQGMASHSATAAAPVPADEQDDGQTAPRQRAPAIQAATARLTLPEDFPDFVPLLSSRRIHSFSPRGGQAVSLAYSTPLDRTKTATFYRERLSEERWEVTLDSLSGGMTSIAARRADGSRLTVNIIENPADQVTMIGIYHSPARDENGN